MICIMNARRPCHGRGVEHTVLKRFYKPQIYYLSIRSNILMHFTATERIHVLR